MGVVMVIAAGGRTRMREGLIRIVELLWVEDVFLRGVTGKDVSSLRLVGLMKFVDSPLPSAVDAYPSIYCGG